ncbi:hypothetical protein HDV06_002253 [Boothiomyces sp. JEL0866]|nr:hypothetical protein HDV06_002253 [Boothiomyces sp. JEL0866]
MQIIPSSFYQTQPWSNLKLLPQNGDQILLSAIFFQAVYLIGGALSTYSSHYRNLKSSKQASWAIHIVSMVFSLIIVTLAYPLFSDPALVNDKLFGYSDYSRSVYAITCDAASAPSRCLTLSVVTAFPYRNGVPFGIFYIYATAATGLGSLNFYWFATMIRSVMSRFKEIKDTKKTQ